MREIQENKTELIKSFTDYMTLLDPGYVDTSVHLVIPSLYGNPVKILSKNIKAFFPHFIDEAWRNMGHSFKCKPEQSVPECNACNPK